MNLDVFYLTDEYSEEQSFWKHLNLSSSLVEIDLLTVFIFQNYAKEIEMAKYFVIHNMIFG